MKHLLFMMIVSAAALPTVVSALSEEEATRWLESDDTNPPNYRSSRINDEEPEFLPFPPKKRTHEHEHKIMISKTSLDDGWVLLSQCHNNMDRVQVAQIVFNRDKIRNIRVLKAKNIGKAWVDGPSVQLEAVKDQAQLCVEAESKSLVRNDAGRFILRNGPFMRKYLDGYFPLHLVVEVVYRSSGLKLVSKYPDRQPGVNIQNRPGKLVIDTWFEGKLFTELVFEQLPQIK